MAIEHKLSLSYWNSTTGDGGRWLLAKNCLLDSLLVQLTSSGSESLNSQASPVQEMKEEQVLSVRSSSRNCHSWMGPEPYIRIKGGSNEIVLITAK
jgi:hypothetical protein